MSNPIDSKIQSDFNNYIYEKTKKETDNSTGTIEGGKVLVEPTDDGQSLKNMEKSLESNVDGSIGNLKKSGTEPVEICFPQNKTGKESSNLGLPDLTGELLKGLDDDILKEMSPEKLAKILSQGSKNGTLSHAEVGKIINSLSNGLFESNGNAAKVLDALANGDPNIAASMLSKETFSDEVLKEMSPEKLAKILSQGSKNGTLSNQQVGEIINSLSDGFFESDKNAAKVLDSLGK